MFGASLASPSARMLLLCSLAASFLRVQGLGGAATPLESASLRVARPLARTRPSLGSTRRRRLGPLWCAGSTPPFDPGDLAAGGFSLFETFRWEPGGGVVRREAHLARLRRSASALGISPEKVGAALEDAVDRAVAEAVAGAVAGAAAGQGEEEGNDLGTPLRVRVDVFPEPDRVEPRVTVQPHEPLPAGCTWRVGVAPQRLASKDPWLGVKTTRRQVYDAARSGLSLPGGLPGQGEEKGAPPLDELLFLNERGEVCEGTITSVFAEIGGGEDGGDEDGGAGGGGGGGDTGARPGAPARPLATPPLACGLLPGVLRGDLLASGAAYERALTLEDLAGPGTRLWVGNSLRGLIRAELVAPKGPRAEPDESAGKDGEDPAGETTVVLPRSGHAPKASASRAPQAPAPTPPVAPEDSSEPKEEKLAEGLEEELDERGEEEGVYALPSPGDLLRVSSFRRRLCDVYLEPGDPWGEVVSHLRDGEVIRCDEVVDYAGQVWVRHLVDEEARGVWLGVEGPKPPFTGWSPAALRGHRWLLPAKDGDAKDADAKGGKAALQGPSTQEGRPISSFVIMPSRPGS